MKFSLARAWIQKTNCLGACKTQSNFANAKRTAYRNCTPAFTLVELMIVVAIIGILAAIAVPSYIDYTRKAKYVEIIQASAPYKTGVEQCFQNRGSITECNQASSGSGIPASKTYSNVASIKVTAAGVITVTPKSGVFYNDPTYVLTPMVSEEHINRWVVSGGCISENLCHAAHSQTKY